MRSNRQGIFELILPHHFGHHFLFCPCLFFLCYAGLSLYSASPPCLLSVTPACFFICHSGLRAGVQVNIDSLTTWIPGQARNDSYISVIPRLRSNRQGIFEFPPFYHSTASFFICHSGLSLYSVTPASFFICHSGLRAGVQVNIDSLATWIPGQARNDSYMSVIPRFRKKTSRDLRISPFLSQHSLFFYLSLRPPSRSPG